MKSEKSIRIDKYLSNMGIGSRKDIKKHIKMGRVKINEKIVKESNDSVNKNDIVRFDNEVIEYEEFTYIMMNKPQGVISATEDKYQNTVLDILEDRYKNRGLFPAGRLDKDTEGLLILTNNGTLAHNMLSPKKHVTKKYLVKVVGRLGESDVKAFENKIVLEDDYECMPAKLDILESDEESLAIVEIKEGKFHQVKRMFLATDKTVVYLKRISMGPISLDESLKLGEYRKLTAEELNLLENYM
ncbi:16S rRNA pseudouridine516 synthase [Acetoanaerobium pronyense]|uniref:Pseudouridine synthase n=1 Tax=Acetoanaerobium pronyense TaxID=1482736 RepID=A0ABS4KQA2_9FIRM|nr:16S rRNA pseudouridine(516) synthase [Acetoanaerobium pronyense]MBP2028789.1 16S rRNA pseudouridine516 synthase [Acetoanaerobium pronyense]